MDAAALLADVQQLQAQLVVTRNEVDGAVQAIKNQQAWFKDYVEGQLVGCRLEMEKAGQFWTALKKEHDDLVRDAVREVKLHEQRLKRLESASGWEDNGTKKRKSGYLTLKDTTPKKLDDKPEELREWKESTLEFLDSQNPGMKALLDKVMMAKKEGI